jgi:hypothetical protein
MEKRMGVGLRKDRASPRAERGSKLMGLLLRIVYGLCILKGRVGLDWLIKGLGCTNWLSHCSRIGPRILNGSNPCRLPAVGETILKKVARGGRLRAPMGARSAAAAPSPFRLISSWRRSTRSPPPPGAAPIFSWHRSSSSPTPSS